MVSRRASTFWPTPAAPRCATQDSVSTRWQGNKPSAAAGSFCSSSVRSFFYWLIIAVCVSYSVSSIERVLGQGFGPSALDAQIFLQFANATVSLQHGVVVLTDELTATVNQVGKSSLFGQEIEFVGVFTYWLPTPVVNTTAANNSSGTGTAATTPTATTTSTTISPSSLTASLVPTEVLVPLGRPTAGKLNPVLNRDTARIDQFGVATLRNVLPLRCTTTSRRFLYYVDPVGTYAAPIVSAAPLLGALVEDRVPTGDRLRVRARLKNIPSLTSPPSDDGFIRVSRHPSQCAAGASRDVGNVASWVARLRGASDFAVASAGLSPSNTTLAPLLAGTPAALVAAATAKLNVLSFPESFFTTPGDASVNLTEMAAVTPPGALFVSTTSRVLIVRGDMFEWAVAPAQLPQPITWTVGAEFPSDVAFYALDSCGDLAPVTVHFAEADASLSIVLQSALSEARNQFSQTASTDQRGEESIEAALQAQFRQVLRNAVVQGQLLYRADALRDPPFVTLNRSVCTTVSRWVSVNVFLEGVDFTSSAPCAVVNVSVLPVLPAAASFTTPAPPAPPSPPFSTPPPATTTLSTATLPNMTQTVTTTTTTTTTPTATVATAVPTTPGASPLADVSGRIDPAITAAQLAQLVAPFLIDNTLDVVFSRALTWGNLIGINQTTQQLMLQTNLQRVVKEDRYEGEALPTVRSLDAQDVAFRLSASSTREAVLSGRITASQLNAAPLTASDAQTATSVAGSAPSLTLLAPTRFSPLARRLFYGIGLQDEQMRSTVHQTNFSDTTFVFNSTFIVVSFPMLYAPRSTAEFANTLRIEASVASAVAPSGFLSSLGGGYFGNVLRVLGGAQNGGEAFDLSTGDWVPEPMGTLEEAGNITARGRVEYYPPALDWSIANAVTWTVVPRVTYVAKIPRLKEYFTRHDAVVRISIDGTLEGTGTTRRLGALTTTAAPVSSVYDLKGKARFEFDRSTVYYELQGGGELIENALFVLSLISLFGRNLDAGALSAVREVADCRMDLARPLDPALHPLHFTLGSTEVQYYAGALVGNGAVAAGVVLIEIGMHLLFQGGPQATRPHFTIVVGRMLYPGITLAAFRVLPAQAGTYLIYVVYMVIVVYCLGLVVATTAIIRFGRLVFDIYVHLETFTPADELWSDPTYQGKGAMAAAKRRNDRGKQRAKESISSRGWLQSMLRLTERCGAYNVLHLDHARILVAHERYRGKARYFNVADYFFIAASCSAYFIDTCDVRVLVLLSVRLAHLISLLVFTPYVSVLGNGLAALIDVLQLSACGLVLRNEYTIARGLLHTTIILGFIFNVVGLVYLVLSSEQAFYVISWVHGKIADARNDVPSWVVMASEKLFDKSFQYITDRAQDYVLLADRLASRQLVTASSPMLGGNVDDVILDAVADADDFGEVRERARERQAAEQQQLEEAAAKAALQQAEEEAVWERAAGRGISNEDLDGAHPRQDSVDDEGPKISRLEAERGGAVVNGSPAASPDSLMTTTTAATPACNRHRNATQPLKTPSAAVEIQPVGRDGTIEADSDLSRLRTRSSTVNPLRDAYGDDGAATGALPNNSFTSSPSSPPRSIRSRSGSMRQRTVSVFPTSTDGDDDDANESLLTDEQYMQRHFTQHSKGRSVPKRLKPEEVVFTPRGVQTQAALETTYRQNLFFCPDHASEKYVARIEIQPDGSVKNIYRDRMRQLFDGTTEEDIAEQFRRGRTVAPVPEVRRKNTFLDRVERSAKEAEDHERYVKAEMASWDRRREAPLPPSGTAARAALILAKVTETRRGLPKPASSATMATPIATTSGGGGLSAGRSSHWKEVDIDTFTQARYDLL